MGNKRIYKSIFGIPIYLILGLSIFILFSAIYDFFVGDRNLMRYFLIGASALIVLISIILHMVRISTIKKIASRQLGE